KRGILSLILLFSFLFSLLFIPWSKDLIHSGGKATFNEIVKSFFNPDLSLDLLKIGITASFQTLFYAVASISIALIIALIFGVLSSGVIYKSPFIKNFFRNILGFMRAIHEL